MNHTIPVDEVASPAAPIRIWVEPAMENRNRLTVAFRAILAIPHILLVGGPIAAALTFPWASEGNGPDWGAGGGVLGAVAAICAIIAWFAIVFGSRHPDGLWSLAAFYLRWRVRATAYLMLLRDEYPPFGDGEYPAGIEILPPPQQRDIFSVALRVILAIPQIITVCILGIAWGFGTVIAWFAILFTGRYPASLYAFSSGMLRWNIRLEAYLLLLRDEYPPFSLD